MQGSRTRTPVLSIGRLREVLSFDSETGIFVWAVRRGRSARGSRAGNASGARRYVQIEVDGERFYAHRLAWFYIYGEWPPHEIDHINGVSWDNRICNLRLATPTQNQYNKRRHRNNTCGVKGVYWHSKRQRWCARARVNGRAVHFGYFTSLDEARRAYAENVEKYHGAFARVE